MPCALDVIDSIRRDLDLTDPNWEDTTIWCRWCGEDHPVSRSQPQLNLIPGQRYTGEAKTAKGSRLPARPKNASATYCVWHETSSPELKAECAYCGADRVHVHQDKLGHVKPGRSGQGYLVERCAACHRYNAVQPVQGQRAIRTAQLENGRPVRQLTIGRL